jgi:DNA-3-methyladenine glycosylase
VEAYLGPEDEASHAAFRPGSHHLFYGAGGHAYVYLNYGVHHCLNAITNPAGRPGCVLMRALEPLAGVGEQARLLSSAVTEAGRAPITAVRFGRGLVLRYGLPELPVRLTRDESDPTTALMARTWTLLSR